MVMTIIASLNREQKERYKNHPLLKIPSLTDRHPYPTPEKKTSPTSLY